MYYGTGQLTKMVCVQCCQRRELYCTKREVLPSLLTVRYSNSMSLGSFLEARSHRGHFRMESGRNHFHNNTAAQCKHHANEMCKI